jgi:hypothetical protein
MTQEIADTTREAVALVFAVAGLLKLRDPHPAEASLGHVINLSRGTRRLVVLSLAVFELAVAAALLLASTTLLVLPAFVLLASFAVFLSLLRLRAPDAPCACLGDAGATTDAVAGLMRNAVLAGLLGIPLWVGPNGFDGPALAPAAQLAILVVVLSDGASLLRRLAALGGSNE